MEKQNKTTRISKKQFEEIKKDILNSPDNFGEDYIKWFLKEWNKRRKVKK